MAASLERALVRVLVTVALVIALLACVLVPIPRGKAGGPDLPAVAFEQGSLFRLEVALLVFYGGLLLVTPAFSGLIRGRLPIEISARGAKFPEETDQSSELIRAFIEETELTTEAMAEDLAAANLAIERLQAAGTRDNTQPKVDSRK
jgi:hypothetical protein